MSKLKAAIIILCILFLAAFSLVSFLKRQYVVPILMYHQIYYNSDPSYPLGVATSTFEKQMRYLKEKHFNVLRLEDLARLIKEKKKIPPRSIAITFDDGYKNNYTDAYPVLKKYGIPATIFVIIDEIGRPQQDRLSWDEIKAMQDSGLITFGSHTLGPEPLINIKSDAELRRQIFDSKRILEEKLGRKVSSFSYPEGRFNSRIRQLVIEACYTAAVSTKPGKFYPNDDIFALKRVRAYTGSNMLIFAVQVSGYYTFMREYNHSGKK